VLTDASVISLGGGSRLNNFPTGDLPAGRKMDRRSRH